MLLSAKAKRRIAFLFLLGLMLWALAWLISVWWVYDLGGGRSEESMAALTVIDFALGNLSQEQFKNKALIHLTARQWDQPSCKRIIPNIINGESYSQQCQYDANGKITGTYLGKPCPPYLASLKDCVRPTIRGNTSEAYSMWCNKWSKEPCIVLGMNQYVLSQPSIFSAILAALETPCKFLPTAQEIAELKKQNQSLSDSITYQQIKDDLGCNDSDAQHPMTIIIEVYNDNLKKLFYIITSRKD